MAILDTIGRASFGTTKAEEEDEGDGSEMHFSGEELDACFCGVAT